MAEERNEPRWAARRAGPRGAGAGALHLAEMAKERDPNIPESEKHPGAPPRGRKRRVAEDRTPGEEKPRRPVGNSQLPDDPAAFPPHG